ncbi:MAG: hypothetical protein ACTSR8_15570 [Promethearchaeota archaeon]
MTKKQKVNGIWKYLHHLVSGFIFLIEGIILFIIQKPLFASLLFIIMGAFLVTDDILAETIDKSIFEKFHSNPIHLKIVGIIFFIIMELIFIFILWNFA